MLKRLGGIIGAFQVEDGMYELYELSPHDFSDNMRPTRSKGAAAGKVGLVSKSVFERKGRSIQNITLR